MSLSITALTERQKELLFDALNKQHTWCIAQGMRKLQGYGKASEKENREQWKNKAEEYHELLNTLADAAN